jgi:hypothetical protein
MGNKQARTIVGSAVGNRLVRFLVWVLPRSACDDLVTCNIIEYTIVDLKVLGSFEKRHDGIDRC